MGCRKVLAFLRRDLQMQASYRLDLLMRVGGMLISVITLFFISRTLGTAVSPYLQQYSASAAHPLDYFHFALMGYAFYHFVELSATSMAEALEDYQAAGTLEMFFLSPTPILATMVMSTLWHYCWAVAESLFYLLVAGVIFRADLVWANLLPAAMVVLLSILANAGLGFINASFVLVTKRPSPLDQLLSLAIPLLAGLYYPVEVLPDWLRAASYLLPATYSFDALRRLMLQGASLADVAPALLALGGFTAVLLPVGLLTFHYAVRWAKVDGSLAQY
jgi:ABC-2 type transport system permease protein